MNIVQHMNSLYYTEKGVKCIMFSTLQIALNHFPSIKHSYHYEILYKNRSIYIGSFTNWFKIIYLQGTSNTLRI